MENKLFSIAQLERKQYMWRFRGDSIVFTNGCFDILHLGHVAYLQQARKLGNRLIVGLNSDESVRRQGKSGAIRPINPEYARAGLLAALSCVDAVVIFDEDTPLKLIQTLLPDILVKGADYKPEEVVGYQEVIKNGGQVICLPLTEGFSTSKIITQILANKTN
ncbi:MAG: D-glycero-beta-D-manno-heptose 1-phosphate adenylyltransferase [Bacteroidia bacterium]|nr:D-glycero-beta-D-manno-heptose 1-phosphate adenylyltransferase [Bacteroidia bacterium]